MNNKKDSNAALDVQNIHYEINDKIDVGLLILSIFIPVVGLVLYFLQKENKPNASKKYGITGLVMLIVSLVFAVSMSAVAVRNVSDSAKGETSVISQLIESKDDSKEKDSKNKSAKSFIDYNNRKLMINGHTYILGKTTLQEMMDDGVVFDDDFAYRANSVVDANKSDSGTIVLSEGWNTYVHFSNFEENTTKTLKDCVLSAVYFTVKEDQEQRIIEFPFSLKMTENKLKKIAGKPTYTSKHKFDDQKIKRYEYKTKSKSHYMDSGYSFEFVNGKLKYIVMDWTP